VLRDPYQWFEEARSHGPVHVPKSRDCVVVTGFQEVLQVLLDTENFSSSVVITPTDPLPFEITGDDISQQLEQTQGHNVMTDLLVTYDGPRHTAARSLLTKLFTPSRLRANEEYMTRLADRMVREIVAKGACEVIHELASPYVTLVIADLLGVPADDREKFRAIIDAGAPAGNMTENDQRQVGHPLMYMAEFFMRYVAERRATPRDDVLTELANAKYPDGSEPDALEIVKAAMFVFAAGQDTSAKLLGNSLRALSRDRELQQKLRSEPQHIPGFIEEMLRVEGSTKATFRLTKRKIKIGNLEVPAGKMVLLALAAANRDPQRWQDPEAFRIGREKIKEHLAFGRGAHVCIGAPLARAEVRVLLEQLLRLTADIRVSTAHHGPAGDQVDYEPSFIIRGLERLHVELTPA
jgi:cytochrome P450